MILRGNFCCQIQFHYSTDVESFTSTNGDSLPLRQNFSAQNSNILLEASSRQAGLEYNAKFKVLTQHTPDSCSSDHLFFKDLYSAPCGFSASCGFSARILFLVQCFFSWCVIDMFAASDCQYCLYLELSCVSLLNRQKGAGEGCVS